MNTVIPRCARCETKQCRDGIDCFSQASLLNHAGTELNILCGLCVGHDAVMSKSSSAPVVTLIAKDRMLAHNPVGAIYSQYVRKNLLNAYSWGSCDV